MAVATGPTLPRTPLEVLENDGCREQPLLSKIFAPVCWGTVGFLGVIVANYASKRPVMSGIQKHIGVSLVAAYAGQLMDNYRTKYLADRDAVYRHYIQLHPEDFPPYDCDMFYPQLLSIPKADCKKLVKKICHCRSVYLCTGKELDDSKLNCETCFRYGFNMEISLHLSKYQLIEGNKKGEAPKSNR